MKKPIDRRKRKRLKANQRRAAREKKWGKDANKAIDALGASWRKRAAEGSEE